MFDRTKQRKLSHKMMIRLNNFLYVFNLRQGTILIAVHQIALSCFILIIMLVGISHVGEMLSMLHNDMEDDAERHGLYETMNANHVTFHEGNVVSTNNQRRFANAQHQATLTVIFLYTSTILTSIYLMCCILLLHGAVKYKREYTLPWIIAAYLGAILLSIGLVIGDGYPCVVKIFGGHHIYRFGCTLFALTLIYAIWTVSSFAMETEDERCRASRPRADERGERLLLLDHAAHSSLLSAAQLNKLSHGTRSEFV